MIEIGIARCQLVDIIMLEHYNSPLFEYFIKNTTKGAVAQLSSLRQKDLQGILTFFVICDKIFFAMK